MQSQNEIAQLLLRIKAVKLSPSSPFTWASGIQSPIYCDNRLALSHPDVRNSIKLGLGEAAKAYGGLTAIAGVATAGIPWGCLLADVLGLPFAYVRSSAKDHGRKNLIEGELEAGARVLVVEDLVSTGGSVLKVVEALQAAEVTVAGVLSVFQYGFESAKNLFLEKNIPFTSLTDYETLVEEAAKNGYISNNDIQTLNDWRRNPDGWGALYA